METTWPTVALVVSRRPEWFEHGLASASFADVIVSRFHDSGRFVDVLNDAITEAREYAPMVFKIDDHDTYPPDHVRLANHWRPGYTVWGICQRTRCDGTALVPRISMCASVFPTDVTLEADYSGRVSASLYHQTMRRRVPSGVNKLLCDWSWGRSPFPCEHAALPAG